MNTTYTLGVGPMSDKIIKSIFSYSHKKSIPLMLIASKNQVDYASGYVATTKDFIYLCNNLKKFYPKSNVLICRDHCGPGFNDKNTLEDVYKTIDNDLENNFDLIHIDFCHLKNQENILKESKKAIEYTLHQNSNIRLEIGTESNGTKDYQNLQKVDEEMKFFNSFCKPDFFVCQTGSLIMEINQVGSFDKDYVKKLSNVAKKNNLSIKEHNADYLSAEEIKERTGIINALNIAPQFGTIQTLLTLEKAKLYGINVDDFLEVSYKSNMWKKWLYKNTANNKLLCSVIAGHYCFRTLEYEKLIKLINKQEDFDLSLENEIFKLLNHYTNNFH